MKNKQPQEMIVMEILNNQKGYTPNTRDDFAISLLERSPLPSAITAMHSQNARFWEIPKSIEQEFAIQAKQLFAFHGQTEHCTVRRLPASTHIKTDSPHK